MQMGYERDSSFWIEELSGQGWRQRSANKDLHTRIGRSSDGGAFQRSSMTFKWCRPKGCSNPRISNNHREQVSLELELFCTGIGKK